MQNADLDRPSLRPHSLTKSAKLLASFAEELGMSDPWRRKFPEKTFFFLLTCPPHLFSNRFFSYR